MPRIKIPMPVSETAVPTPAAPAPVPSAPAPIPAAPVAPTPVAATIAERRPTSARSKLLIIVGAVAFGIVVILLISTLNDRHKLETQVTKLSGSSSGGGTAAQQITDLTKQIGASFQLPAGETPTLATVSDASKVRSQAFFKDAQNGDKVLLYSKAGEAILYRPSTKKIISVAPVNLGGGASSGTSPTTP